MREHEVPLVPGPGTKTGTLFQSMQAHCPKNAGTLSQNMQAHCFKKAGTLPKKCWQTVSKMQAHCPKNAGTLS